MILIRPAARRSCTDFGTLVNLLRYRRAEQPDRLLYTFLQDGEVPASTMTFRDLDARARAIAARLQAADASGERALMLYAAGPDFIAAFLGCLYAGVVAVPVYPPRRNQHAGRLQAIVADCEASLALTTTALLDDVHRHFAQDAGLAALPTLATDAVPDSLADDWQEPALSRDDLAFLQYTSGSTGDPKGVMVSHRNLLHNLETIKQAFGLSANSVSVTWLPSFHDMGLIDGLLEPMYAGYQAVVMAPQAFLQQPIRWLRAISRYGATHSGGPNFAYDYCVRKVTPEQREALDLSCWLGAYNGSEPVRHATLERFTAAFRGCGFRPQYHYPCYGMAESTLMVTGGELGRAPASITVDGQAIAHHLVVEAKPGDPDARDLVGSGRPRLGTAVVIANPDTAEPCAPGRVGEIWVAGPSVAQGYWNRPEKTQRTFRAHLASGKAGTYLRTGDLGFIRDGELFITGRLKDMLIIRGRNHYPQDIELTVEQSHPAVRPGACAAVSVQDDGEERLVVVAEVERTRLRDMDSAEVVEQIRRGIAERHDLQVHAVALIRPASIPKTSSGKLRRHACRQAFLDNSLSIVA